MKSFKTFIIESKIRKSYFDSSIPVVILYKTDEEYNIWEPRFKKYGWAIGILDKKIIIEDGEIIKNLTKTQILFVESHECSHFILGEKATEVECDWLAIANLWKKGFKNAAKLGIDTFEERNNVLFDTSDLPGYDSWIKRNKHLGECFILECKEKNIEILKALKNSQKFNIYPSKSTLESAWEIYTESIIH